MKQDNPSNRAEQSKTAGTPANNTIGANSIFADILSDTNTADKATETTETSVSAQNAVQAQEIQSTVQTTATVQSMPDKPQRVGVKQRKSNFADYKATYMVPAILTKENRHAVNITRTTWELLERYARILGDRDMNVGSYAENIIRDHLDNYADDLEAWRKL